MTAGRLRANNDDLCLRVGRVDYHFTRYLVDIRIAVLFSPQSRLAECLFKPNVSQKFTLIEENNYYESRASLISRKRFAMPRIPNWDGRGGK